MKKQTAVEWLEESISKKLSSEIDPYFLDLFDQAKEMENYQIIDFAENFSMQDHCKLTAEQYYNETYGEDDLLP
jgi:hypothetical protein